MSYDYRLMNPVEESIMQIEVDSTLFFAPLRSSGGMFESNARWSFDFVRYSARGFCSRYATLTVNGVDLSRIITDDYQLVGQLYSFRALHSILSSSHISDYGASSAAQSDEFSLRATSATARTRMQIAYTEQNYRIKAALNSTGQIGSNWYYRLAAERRWGRDRFVEGVFSDIWRLGLSLDRTFANNSAISISLLAAPEQKGLRQACVAETFELTGDNYYNPSWGLWNGKVRNSRVRRSFVPLTVVTFDARAGAHTSMSISVAARHGKRSVSGLAWFDATNPSPDYYTSLPSYFDSEDIRQSVAQAWEQRDKRITQVDWNELCIRNRLSSASCIYLVQERVEQITDLNAAANFRTTGSERFEFDYGVQLRQSNKRQFKLATDLLGGSGFADVDQYLIDDEYFGQKTANNTLQPDRRIVCGDRFGYDYSILEHGGHAYGVIRYRQGRGSVDIGATVGTLTMQRAGHYRKELFGDNSFGRSAKIRFAPYSFKLTADYALSVRNRIGLTLNGQTIAPNHEDVFLSPESNNLTVQGIVPEKILSAQVDWNIYLGPVEAEVSAYFLRSNNRSTIRSYWDDVASEYCQMIIGSMDRTAAGVELGARIDLLPRVQMLLLASASRYRYADDACYRLLRNNDAEAIVTDGVVMLNGFAADLSPERIASCRFSYSEPFGWQLSLSANYAARRYVEPNPTRRTARVAALASSPEHLTAMMQQERLPDAFTLDLHVARAFTVRQSSFYVSLSVNNLLDNRSIVYYGYEQMRLRRSGVKPAVNYMPMESKYTYSYPRNIYLSISYSF